MLIIRFDEIGIKGNNRTDFERKLAENIRAQGKQSNVKNVKIKPGRILADADNGEFLKRVFGVSSYSSAVILNYWNEVIEAVNSLQVAGSFRVTCQRLDKTFPKKSPEVEKEIGAAVQQRTGAKVSLKSFDTEICIEIIDGKFFVFTERISGPGGLPVGIEGNVHLKDDSEICALLMMKRGCRVFSDSNLELAQQFSPNRIDKAAENIICEAEEAFLPRRNNSMSPVACMNAEEKEEMLAMFRSLLS